MGDREEDADDKGHHPGVAVARRLPQPFRTQEEIDRCQENPEQGEPSVGVASALKLALVCEAKPCIDRHGDEEAYELKKWMLLIGVIQLRMNPLKKAYAMGATAIAQTRLLFTCVGATGGGVS